jgi:hypothetical protein
MYPRKRVTSIPTPHPYQPGPDHSEPFCHYISAHEPPPPAEPLPPHMRLNGWPSVPFPLNKLCEIIITTCCLLSYGSRNLQGSWDACVEGGERWDAFVDRYAARMSQLNIIVSQKPVMK